MSLYPTLEDMEVSQMAATQHAAEQRLTQNAITAAGSGQTMGKICFMMQHLALLLTCCAFSVSFLAWF